MPEPDAMKVASPVLRGPRHSNAPGLPDETPVLGNRTCVGLDVHARSVWACAVDDESGEMRTQRISPKTPEVVKWVKALPGDVEVAYEAGPTGFGLARSLIAAGVRCHVLAPSKMDRPSGDRVKTDLLTELPDLIPRASPVSPGRVARFRGHGQRRGCAAGVVAVGGSAVRVA